MNVIIVTTSIIITVIIIQPWILNYSGLISSTMKWWLSNPAWLPWSSESESVAFCAGGSSTPTFILPCVFDSMIHDFYIISKCIHSRWVLEKMSHSYTDTHTNLSLSFSNSFIFKCWIHFDTTFKWSGCWWCGVLSLTFLVAKHVLLFRNVLFEWVCRSSCTYWFAL